MVATKPKFGQVASDYVPTEGSDAVWIRTFKDPTTLIRICPAEGVNEAGQKVYGAEAWPTEREHFVRGSDFGTFPCVKRFGMDCPGCNDPSEEVRKPRRQYYVNALDEDGELRVFKFGVNLYKVFLARQERAMASNPRNKQPLSDRDYMIHRSGKGLDTTYDPESGEKYEVDWPEELHDIEALLEERWEQAQEYYELGGGAAAEDEDDEPPARRVGAKKAAAKKTAARRPAAEDEDDAEETPTRRVGAKKATARRRPAEEEDDYAAPDNVGSEDEDGEFGPLGQTPTEDEINDATTTDLKAFLTGRGAEFPARAPLSRLRAIALRVADEPPY